MPKASTFYTRRARASLVLLWIGAIILLMLMLYNWRIETDSSKSSTALLKAKGIFADELLLSSQDLQLGENVGLINISLNRGAIANAAEDEAKLETSTSPERKLVYSKMLKNKIKKISSTPSGNGFIIKPLPQ
ncbi:hypothetical protein U0035_10645 [Niabella yanshanensis]|uniref:Uncharacterized protein n=1 Tax=Niabella yanshanensis TaxID=577386 RepID=A0ABZ0WBN8_9BACT|nr:hypothetical protein [Niabella yanshanensis]WQD40606.1 hypothetical protein U0035_10645 [Niabella yanshanensis]